MSEEKEQLKCSFCGKPLEQVYKLIAGPDVYICDECVRIYMEKLDKYLRRKQKRCSFCGKKEEKVRKLIVSPIKKIYICDECLGLCVEILEEEEASLQLCEKGDE